MSARAYFTRRISSSSDLEEEKHFSSVTINGNLRLFIFFSDINVHLLAGMVLMMSYQMKNKLINNSHAKGTSYKNVYTCVFLYILITLSVRLSNKLVKFLSFR